MADENKSRLLESSASFRNQNLIKNSCRYICGKEYDAVSKDILSDGDCRGRDPESDGGTIGTNLDISCRNSLLAKNSNLYTKGNEYGEGHPNTLSDGDTKGRDPQQQGGLIGTSIDIQQRTCLLAKNACRYTTLNPYDATSPDVFSDGDCRGRDPKVDGGTIGTNLDIQQRNNALVRNRYLNSSPYGEGNC